MFLSRSHECVHSILQSVILGTFPRKGNAYYPDHPTTLKLGQGH